MSSPAVVFKVQLQARPPDRRVTYNMGRGPLARIGIIRARRGHMRTFVAFLTIFSVSAAFVAALGPQADQSVRHVVVFKYKAGATPAQIQQVTTEFRNLRSRVPGITAFEHGVNNSPENKNLGFTHVYLLTDR